MDFRNLNEMIHLEVMNFKCIVNDALSTLSYGSNRVQKEFCVRGCLEFGLWPGLQQCVHVFRHLAQRFIKAPTFAIMQAVQICLAVCRIRCLLFHIRGLPKPDKSFCMGGHWIRLK